MEEMFRAEEGASDISADTAADVEDIDPFDVEFEDAEDMAYVEEFLIGISALAFLIVLLSIWRYRRSTTYRTTGNQAQGQRMPHNISRQYDGDDTAAHQQYIPVHTTEDTI